MAAYRHASTAFHAKALGFTRFLFDVMSMEWVHPSMAFQDLVVSVQPNLQ
ncbi:MAG: hypothetical protein OXN27_14815 [Candidatus Poribacteria bacterium]|nr:hypothetical protein [Candidatus Poribacteria bacterium]